MPYTFGRPTLLAACIATTLSGQSRPSYQNLPVQLTRYELDTRIDYAAEQVIGTARMTVRNGSTAPVSEIPIISYRLMPLEAVTDSAGRALSFVQDVVSYEDDPKRQVTFARVSLLAPLPAGRLTTIVVRYRGFLLGYAETGSRYVRDRVDPEFTILRDDGLGFPMLGYPSRLANRSQGMSQFDYLVRVTVPETLWVANGGRLRERSTAGGRARFEYENLKPAWRMDFAIAPYRILERGDLRVVYFPADSIGAERVLKAAQRSMALYTEWFGSIIGGGHFTVIEIPDGFGSQSDVTSITQTAAAFKDPNQRRQLYHEIFHLWDVPPNEPLSARLDEGLATFLEYYTADRLDGAASLEERLEVVRRWLQDMVTQRPDLKAHPLKAYGRERMTDFSYSMGMILFAVMHDVLGEEGFLRVVRECHLRHGQSGGTLDDFVGIAKSMAPDDLTRFFDDWVYSTRWVEAVAAAGSVKELAARYRGPHR